MPAATAALHQGFFTIDTHCDTPTASLLRPGWDFGAAHRWGDDPSQCDLPRMRSGGIDAIVFAVYVAQAARTERGLGLAHEIAERALARTHEVLANFPAECALALTASDGPRLKGEGRRAIYLSLENGYSLGRNLGHVAKFHRQGVRMLGLTHMLNNDLADSSTDPRGPEWGGLSPFGREVVAECNRLGIVLDASHASDQVLEDLLTLSRTPVILSHSDCRKLCDHPRNIGDELLRSLARQGGVIQINALPISLVPAPQNGRTAAIAELLIRFKDSELTLEARAVEAKAYDEVCARFPNPAVHLDDFIRHLEHAVEVAGIDHVGIGCDFDGGGGGFPGLEDVGAYPQLTQALLARGWRSPDLAKIWGENTLRLFRAAEAGAAAELHFPAGLT